jgi:hypothetical protein
MRQIIIIALRRAWDYYIRHKTTVHRLCHLIRQNDTSKQYFEQKIHKKTWNRAKENTQLVLLATSKHAYWSQPSCIIHFAFKKIYVVMYRALIAAFKHTAMYALDWLMMLRARSLRFPPLFARLYYGPGVFGGRIAGEPISRQARTTRYAYKYIRVHVCKLDDFRR